MDVKRAFSRRVKQTKSSTLSPSNDWVESQVSKARYIFRLDPNQRENRNGSGSSTSTSKLRSVTFSEATTAPVYDFVTIDEDKAQQLSQKLQAEIPLVSLYDSEEPVCQRKPSEFSLQSQTSTTSLHSYYDKDRAPLSISQQTSNSLIRDRAWRRSTNSIPSEYPDETEQPSQARSASRTDRRSSREVGLTSHPVREVVDNSPVKLVRDPIADEIVRRTAAATAKTALARISVVRGTSQASDKVVTPLRHTLEHELPHRPSSNRPDPTQAKLNVRRPKAGTKNWFDDIDSESDEEDVTYSEPQLEADFALRVEHAFERGNFDIVPPRTSSRLLKTTGTTDVRKKSPNNDVSKSLSTTSVRKSRAKQSTKFADIDLQNQSVLYLSSSDEEDEDEAEQEVLAGGSVSNLFVRRLEASGRGDRQEDSCNDNGHVKRLNIKVPDIRVADSPARPMIPKRNSHRMLTHLDDISLESLSHGDNLLTSFPHTPSGTSSPQISVQSADLDSDDGASTKVVSLTKQEEKLIAALRSKKDAMKTAYASAHREKALRTLEMPGGHGEPSTAAMKRRSSSPAAAITSKGRQYSSRIEMPPSTSNAHGWRFATTPDVPHTFDRSDRSSMMTYMTDLSQNLQSPGESIDGLSPTMLAAPQPRVYRSHLLSGQTFLSTTTISSTTSKSTQLQPERSVDMWNDYANPSDGLHIRPDVPSQLFMERPYLGWQGWEGRTDVQVAH